MSEHDDTTLGDDLLAEMQRRSAVAVGDFLGADLGRMPLIHAWHALNDRRLLLDDRDALTAALREARDAAAGMAVAYENARTAQIEAEAELARYKAFADEVLLLIDDGDPAQDYSWAEAYRITRRAIRDAESRHLGDTATTNGGNGA